MPDPEPRDDSSSLAGDRELAERGLLVLEGSFLVERGAAAGLELVELYCVPAREAWARSLAGAAIEPTVLPEAEIARVAGYPFHRGALAVARRPPPRTSRDLVSALAASEAAASTVLALPEAIDPANLGAAARSAAALGCRALLLGPSGPDPLSRRALRASMGAALSLPWARLEGPASLAALADSGYAIAACVLDGGALDLRAFSPPPRLTLVLGNEAFGLSAPWLDACGLRLTLPMLGGTNSLNLAAAAAIFLYALADPAPLPLRGAYGGARSRGNHGRA